jgi:regulator of sigma D
MLKAALAWLTYDMIELAYKPDVKHYSRNEKSVKGTFPMQEERLETVEYNLRQFKTETIRAYQDMAFEMTMIKGLTEDTIKQLAKLSDTMEKRFDAVDQRFERVETRLDRVESMLAQILARLPEKP